MIIIFSALYCEAKPIIQGLRLKKEDTEYRFPLYRNEQILLSITGTGKIAAASAVSSLLTILRPSSSDFVVNIGTCAALDEAISKTRIYMGSSITDYATQRTAYPDILFCHSFDEIAVLTCEQIYQRGNQKLRQVVIDMESFSIFQSASYFVQPHQLSFLKVVSDYGDSELLSPAFVTSAIEQNMEAILSWIHTLQSIQTTDSYKTFCGFTFTGEEQKSIQKLCSDLKCSVTMEHQLIQHLHYAKLIHGSFDTQLHSFYTNYADCLPCKIKPEGKTYLGYLKTLLLQ